MKRIVPTAAATLSLVAAVVTGAGFAARSVGTSQPRPGNIIPTLTFAIVGACRPANPDNVAGYPSAVITRIWQDVQAQNPPPAFAVTTGNYMFASPTHTPSTASSQLDLYLNARANYQGKLYPAMGNDECTGAASSNCGPGNPNGETPNYTAFLTKLVRPTGHDVPYYEVDYHSRNDGWTAKFLFIAGNAWNAEQATWLDHALSRNTTYTFIVRTPSKNDRAFPCMASGAINADTIIAKHPYTLLIVGRPHTFAYYAGQKEVVVGNGGAPLVGSVNYGYVIARQQPNRQMTFTAYDYSTNAAVSTFTVNP
ncbi:MAG TPA: hypothetical protein VKT78_20610 [Fimbriimonadaceae bacterium]|nr:hypothetical protein [Fimbriimonadaceae bacterium]